MKISIEQKNSVNLPKCNIISRFIKRSKTNKNEPAKQYFVLIGSEGKENVLVVRKFVLINSGFNIYERYGFKLLKKYKDSRLYVQIFSIKIDTFNDVVNWLYST